MDETGQARYSPEKPADCRFCYFWQGEKKGCMESSCYYLLQEAPEVEKNVGCRGCPYGRVFPCIGYCLRKLMMGLGCRVRE